MEVIRVENLSKLYDLGQVGTGTLSKDLNRWWARARGKDDPYAKVGQVNDRTRKAENDESVWALRDINFSVNQGEVVGIIGRNGAGKSTLLKIISRITTPTTGAVKVKGRIASLLEVGTGFHPEMTGRENIFMNGTLLGMTRREIQSKLDEIVDFAGVAMYIDTPVKRYSSGMQVRLGFAVAAFLEPEILIVDEVLAVGDVEFQKKAIGRMQEVSKGDGRTVLFVSHNMGSIMQLCTSAILLKNGSLEVIGDTGNVVEYYTNTTFSVSKFNNEPGSKDMAITEASLISEQGNEVSAFQHNQKILVSTKIHVNRFIEATELRLVVRDKKGKAIFTSDKKISSDHVSNNRIQIVAEISNSFLRPGSFMLTFALFIPHRLIIDLQENVLPLSITDGGSKYAASEGLDYGYIFFEPKWYVNGNHEINN